MELWSTWDQQSSIQMCFLFIYSSSANDAETKTRVAIKKLARPFQSNIHAKRTYREIRMLKHMDHENVSRDDQFNVQT